MGHDTASPPVAASVPELRAQVARWRAEGARIALVPTMGALHAGHLALVRRAQAEAERTIVSIFVNPTQFAPTEDFSSYPRSFAADYAALAGVGADLVYAPTPGAMYPARFSSAVAVGGPALAGLEDAFRPHFFGGVATVVAKLLIQGAPDLACFGEKDYQQLLVIRRMIDDLDLPVRIIGVPTVREADGLALSSRNVHLSADERAAAGVLPLAMQNSAAALREGAPFGEVLPRGRAALEAAGFVVDYLDVRDARPDRQRLRGSAAPAGRGAHRRDTAHRQPSGVTGTRDPRPKPPRAPSPRCRRAPGSRDG